ncbi:hypothetical protein TB2_037564 [Malus domestica]
MLEGQIKSKEAALETPNCRGLRSSLF